MRRRIVRRPLAKRDVVQLGDFIAQDSLAAARRFRDAVKTTLAMLLASPDIGGCWETSNPKYEGMRSWSVEGFPNHLIFYRPISEGIEVIRILHAARDLESLFSVS